MLDHVGNVHRHGWPDDPREWSLDDRLKRAGAAGPPAPSVRTCEVCFAAFKPAPLCPCCGSPAKLSACEIQHRDGVLQELEREAVQQRTTERKKAHTLQQLIAVGQARGMRNPVGWAKHVHNARQRS